MIAMDDTPRVWVGCLACHNAGRMVGEWVDAADAESACDIDYALRRDMAAPATPELAETMRRIRLEHLAERHEEWWCFDHENMRGLVEGECSPAEAERLAGLVEAIEADGHPVAAVVAWSQNTGERLEEWDRPTRDSFADAFAGEWCDEEEYARDLAESIGSVPADYSWPASYIDWESATRDLFSGDYYSTRAPGGVYVFRSL
jgi:antirestriction protein